MASILGARRSRMVELGAVAAALALFLVPATLAGQLVGHGEGSSCSATVAVICANSWIQAYNDGCTPPALGTEWVCRYHFVWSASGSSPLPSHLYANLYVNGGWVQSADCGWDTEGGCTISPPKTYSGSFLRLCYGFVTVNGDVLAESKTAGGVSSGVAHAHASIVFGPLC